MLPANMKLAQFLLSSSFLDIISQAFDAFKEKSECLIMVLEKNSPSGG